jgi:O-antigen ligase
MSSANPRGAFSANEDTGPDQSRPARVLGSTVFVATLCLLGLSALPYGTSQPWWRAFLVCAIFLLAILWLGEGWLSNRWFAGSGSLVIPLALLAVFSLVQTLPYASAGPNPAGIAFTPWNAISADPYQTRFFAVELLALTLAGVFLFRYAATERRTRLAIKVVIAIAVASAVFGILRQTTQHSAGFGLPLLLQDQGYAQFINRNHFAYLMEMGLGLIVGLILGGGVKREQSLIYVAALLPLWTALVLCGSRGGLVAMLAQLVVAALLFSRFFTRSSKKGAAFAWARSWPAQLGLTLLLLVGVVVGTIWLGGDQLATRLEDSRNELNVDPTGSRQGASRSEIWSASWKLFRAHPIPGVGMGAYWAAIPAVHNASGTLTPQEAHNDYLELLTSGGIPGFLLGVWFVLVVCRRVHRNLRSADRARRAASFGAALGLAGVAVHSLVDFGLHTLVNAMVFTTLIFIATSNARWASEPGQQP